MVEAVDESLDELSEEDLVEESELVLSFESFESFESLELPLDSFESVPDDSVFVSVPDLDFLP